MKYDVIRYHPSDTDMYLVMGVGMTNNDATAFVLGDMERFSDHVVLARAWGEDRYGVVLYGQDYDRLVWCYLIKKHDDSLPPLGFWRE